MRHAASGHIYWRALSTDARGNVTCLCLRADCGASRRIGGARRLGNGVEELRAHEDATGFLTSIKSYAPNAGGAVVIEATDGSITEAVTAARSVSRRSSDLKW